MSNTTVKVDEQANARAQYLTGLMWHAGAYLIISALLIVLDLLGTILRLPGVFESAVKRLLHVVFQTHRWPCVFAGQVGLI